MTQDEIIRSPLGREQLVALAREACAPNQTFNSDEEWVKRFAALVAAHERNRLAWTQEHWTEYEHAIAAAERETCAKSVYDSTDWAHEERDMVLKEAIAAAIRSRSNEH